MLLEGGRNGAMPGCGGPSPLVQLRASGTFLVTSQLGQPLEIDALT